MRYYNTNCVILIFRDIIHYNKLLTKDYLKIKCLINEREGLCILRRSELQTSRVLRIWK